MAFELLSQSDNIAVEAVAKSPPLADKWAAELQTLLRELETVTAAGHALPPVFSEVVDEHLVRARLGVGASLFAALRCKNAAVAGHALRVAMNCSAWAMQMNLPEVERDAIEVAALLHDIGVIGAPDHILLKAAALDSDEKAEMSRARKMSVEVLRNGCASQKVLEIVENVPTWFGDRLEDDSPAGAPSRIPLGSRMIAIVEAFDAMTTDHVYRPARSHERAMAELFECSHTQFDPELVHRFAEFRQSDQKAIHWEVAHRWLRSLDSDAVHSHWGLNAEPSP
jgi:HD-GYP domain-containing protein (c-di-GMP phosphodiesterase class II)